MNKSTAWLGSVILLAMAGYTADFLALSGQPSPGISFLYGGVAVLLAAAMFGPVSGLVVGIIVAMPTVDAWGHPWAVVIGGLEGLACGLLVHRFRVGETKGLGLSLSLANIVFWATLGIPLTYTIYSYLLPIPTSSVGLIMTKWAMNGVFNAALAEFLLFLVIAPNLGGWLRVKGAHISRWRIRDMYVASIVVATVSIVLVTIGIETRQHVEEQYAAQRKHQENTLVMLKQLLPAHLNNISGQKSDGLARWLASTDPQYALKISTATGEVEIGAFPPDVPTDGPVYEVIEPTSRLAAEMDAWLQGHMVLRSADPDNQSRLVLVSKIQPIIESLWRNTAEIITASTIAAFIIVLIGLVFSRYVTRSLTQLANASASIGALQQHSKSLYAEITGTSGFEPKETHDVRMAFSTALREEASAYQASQAAAANTLKIVEEANAPIVAIDMAGAIVGWNRASERATGLEQQAVLGKKTEEVLIDSIPTVDSQRIITRLRKGGSLEGMRLSFKNTDGRRVTLLLSGVVLNDVDGEPNRLIMVGQNLTEYLEQEQQLLQASKMSTLGEMATGVAHELNQPLNTMRLTIANVKTLIARKPDQVGALDDKLQRLNDQIDRATKIIDHLRLYGRRGDTQTPNGDVFSPDKTIQSCIALFQEQFRVANIQLTCSLNTHNLLASGDSMLFEQVLVNLLSNARDAINSQGAGGDQCVQVASSLNNGAITVSIEDTGGGAEAHTLSHMFEPFYTSKAPGHGTGLGLSISYSIISSMSGSITAENGERGLCVTIALPIAPPKTN